MKLEIADYIELKDGGAVVVFEMDEEARKGLLCEAIKSRILDGLDGRDKLCQKRRQARRYRRIP